jgi:hypothetical protein
MKRSKLFLVSLFFVLSMPFVCAIAEVNININVPPLPPLAFPEPPDVVVVPSESSDVYLVPGTAGLYFFGGRWYRFHNGYWFNAPIYSGPWVVVEEALIPPAVVVIPPDYVLAMPPGYHRIHYGEFHSHWRDWDHRHYWNRHSWYREQTHHHWGGKEFYRPTKTHQGDIHRDIHHTRATDRRGKVTGDKVGPGERTFERGKPGHGTKTVGTGNVGHGTKPVVGGSKVGTAQTSKGGGHGGRKSGVPVSKDTRHGKQE